MCGSSRSSVSRGPLMVAYAVYVPLAVGLIWLCRHQLNVDGVSYIRIAGYYSKLDLDLAVNGYWSPLLSWLLVPWQMVGADVLLGAKVTNGLAGALFVLGVHRLARGMGLGGPVGAVMPVCAGLVAIRWLAVAISPDLLLAAFLTLYFGDSLEMSRSLKAGHGALAGLWAGMAYLAKGYALPFFALHHLLAALVVAKRTGGRWASGRNVACYVAGMAACLLVAGPWIGVLSRHYGRPTFSTTGEFVHALAGPAGDFRDIHWLAVPREGRITTWEDPTEKALPWPQWSAFDGASAVAHQLRLFYRNGRVMAEAFFAADGLGLMYMTLIALPLLACVPRREALPIDPWLWRWSVAAVGAYLSGFMFVFAGSGRYYLPLEGLLLVLAGTGAVAVVSMLWPRDEAGPAWSVTDSASVAGPGRSGLVTAIGPAPCEGSRPEGAPTGGGRRRECGGSGSGWRSAASWKMVMAVVIVMSCVSGLVETAREAFQRPGLAMERIARQLAAAGVEGPLASNHWHSAVMMSYYLDVPCAGVPVPGTPEEVLGQMAEAKVRTYLSFEGELKPDDSVVSLGVEQAVGPLRLRVKEGSIGVEVYEVNR